MHHDALIRRGSRLFLARVPTDPLPVDGVTIALSFVGVCGTDLQILNGKRPDTARILGHEGVGHVVATDGALRIGEAVVFNPAAQLSMGLILGHNVPGLLQRNFTVGAQAVADGVVMPAGIGKPEPHSTLAEPLASVIYGYELIRNAVPDLQSVAIFGAGPVGLLAALYLREQDLDVVLIHRSQTRLDTIGRLGFLRAGATCLATEDVAVGRSVDAAMICTTRIGAPSALHHAIKMVRQGGCIDLLTNYPEDAVAPCDTASLREVRAANVCGLPREGRYLLAGRIAFTGHRGTSHDHLKKALLALSADKEDYRKLITHVLPLEQCAFAIEELAQSTHHRVNGQDCIKLVIDLTAGFGDG